MFPAILLHVRRLWDNGVWVIGILAMLMSPLIGILILALWIVGSMWLAEKLGVHFVAVLIVSALLVSGANLLLKGAPRSISCPPDDHQCTVAPSSYPR